MSDIKEKNTIVSLNDKTSNLIDNIIEEEDFTKVKDMLNLFNVNIAKKNAARVVKLNSLLDSINDEAIKRFERCPDEVSNKELLDYMDTVQNQISKSSETIKSITSDPAIQLVNQTNEVNININNPEKTLSRESRERVLNAINSIINAAKADTIEQADIIDVEVNDGNN